MPSKLHPVRLLISAAPSSKSEGSPRKRLTMKPFIRDFSAASSSAWVPTSAAITPPRSMSPTMITGTSAASAKPILAMSPWRRLISAGEPAPSTTIRSKAASSRPKLSKTAGSSSPFRSPYSRAFKVAQRFPWTTTCAPVSVSGLRSTGFMCTDGATRAARACSICARPISPPSAATPALFDMFCGLNGATFSPRSENARQSPATIRDLPTFEPVPWIMIAARLVMFSNCQRVVDRPTVARPSFGGGTLRPFRVREIPDRVAPLGGAGSCAYDIFLRLPPLLFYQARRWPRRLARTVKSAVESPSFQCTTAIATRVGELMAAPIRGIAMMSIATSNTMMTTMTTTTTAIAMSCGIFFPAMARSGTNIGDRAAAWRYTSTKVARRPATAAASKLDQP